MCLYRGFLSDRVCLCRGFDSDGVFVSTVLQGVKTHLLALCDCVKCVCIERFTMTVVLRVCSRGFTVAGRVCSEGFNGTASAWKTCLYPEFSFDRCVCLEGFTGAQCEAEAVTCETVRCHNGGVCRQNLQGDGVTCDCTPGFRGNRCQEHITVSQQPESLSLADRRQSTARVSVFG